MLRAVYISKQKQEDPLSSNQALYSDLDFFRLDFEPLLELIDHFKDQLGMLDLPASFHDADH